MIGNDQRVRSRIHCTARVVSGMDAFYHDGSIPRLANPSEIIPSHHRLLERRSDIRVQHRSLPRDDHILELHQSAVREKRCQPARLCQKLIHKRQHRSEFTAKEFLGAVANVAFPHTCHSGVDCDNESRKPCFTRALDSCQGAITSSDQVELIPNWRFRCGCHVLQTATRKCR